MLLELHKYSADTIAEGFPQPTEQTATAWRFAIDLKPAETRTVRLGTDRPETQSIGIEDAVPVFLNIANEQGASPAIRAAIANIADLENTQSARTEERDQLTAQRDALDTDEQRLRENLKATQPGDALHTRLIRQLDADETRSPSSRPPSTRPTKPSPPHTTRCSRPFGRWISKKTSSFLKERSKELLFRGRFVMDKRMTDQL